MTDPKIAQIPVTSQIVRKVWKIMNAGTVLVHYYVDMFIDYMRALTSVINLNIFSTRGLNLYKTKPLFHFCEID